LIKIYRGEGRDFTSREEIKNGFLSGGEIMPRSRPFEELRIRATCHRHGDASISVVVGDEFLKTVITESLSPAKTFELAYKETQCLACAKACRWLAVIRRDYGEEKAKEVWGLM